MKIVLHILPTLLSVILLAGCAGEHETPAVSQGAESSVSSGVSQARPAPQESPEQKHGNATPMGYNTYFSEDRPFESGETSLEHGDLTRAADAIQKLLGEQWAQRETGKACRFGNLLYLYAAPDLFEYDLETNRVSIICSGTISKISDLQPFDNVDVEYDVPLLFLSPDVAFYAVNREIYRCHIPSRTSEPVYRNDKLVSFDPLSNNTILITAVNAEWEKAVSETGVQDNGMPEFSTFQYHINDGKTEPWQLPSLCG